MPVCGTRLELNENNKNNEDTYVPAKVTITITLDTYYTPDNLRDEFNLDDFREGKLLDKGYI